MHLSEERFNKKWEDLTEEERKHVFKVKAGMDASIARRMPLQATEKPVGEFK